MRGMAAACCTHVPPLAWAVFPAPCNPPCLWQDALQGPFFPPLLQAPWFEASARSCWPTWPACRLCRPPSRSCTERCRRHCSTLPPPSCTRVGGCASMGPGCAWLVVTSCLPGVCPGCLQAGMPPRLIPACGGSGSIPTVNGIPSIAYLFAQRKHTARCAPAAAAASSAACRASLCPPATAGARAARCEWACQDAKGAQGCEFSVQGLSVSTSDAGAGAPAARWEWACRDA